MNGIQTHDFCDTGAVVYQLYQARHLGAGFPVRGRVVQRRSLARFTNGKIENDGSRIQKFCFPESLK